MSEDMADRDVAADRLIEVGYELQRKVREHLLDERCRVHYRRITVEPNELPVANDGDRSAHPRTLRPRVRNGAGASYDRWNTVKK
jgi:hypothetical protein